MSIRYIYIYIYGHFGKLSYVMFSIVTTTSHPRVYHTGKCASPETNLEWNGGAALAYFDNLNCDQLVGTLDFFKDTVSFFFNRHRAVARFPYCLLTAVSWVY